MLIWNMQDDNVNPILTKIVKVYLNFNSSFWDFNDEGTGTHPQKKDVILTYMAHS